VFYGLLSEIKMDWIGLSSERNVDIAVFVHITAGHDKNACRRKRKRKAVNSCPLSSELLNLFCTQDSYSYSCRRLRSRVSGLAIWNNCCRDPWRLESAPILCTIAVTVLTRLPFRRCCCFIWHYALARTVTENSKIAEIVIVGHYYCELCQRYNIKSV